MADSEHSVGLFRPDREIMGVGWELLGQSLDDGVLLKVQDSAEGILKAVDFFLRAAEVFCRHDLPQLVFGDIPKLLILITE